MRTYRSMFSLCLCVSMLALCAVLASGQGTPSSKATAAINTSVGCVVKGTSNIGETVPIDCHDIFSGDAVNVTADNFAEIMKTTVKVSNSQSLFVSPSLVTGLYTNTKTKTSVGSTSVATALGSVYMRAVLKDSAGNIVKIGYPVAVCTADILGCQSDANNHFGVILDSRVQTLSQSLSDCVVNVGTEVGTCTFDSTIGLILQTTSAHTFNLIFPNVGVGVYTLSVQAAVKADGMIGSGSGTAIGSAAFGLGSVTVDSVRLVHDFSF
jgi:hypothetical protein